MTVKQYDIVLNYDTSKADASLASFRAGVIRSFQELQSRTAKIEVLKDLQKDAADANANLVKLKDRSDELARVLGKLGKGDVGFKQLAAEVKVAERDLKAAEKAAGAIADKIRLLDGELRAAGVDTKNLAAEQAALARALEASQRAIAAQAARQTLGVVSTDEARAQIAKLREAYDVLRASGTATTNELAVAKANLNAKIREVEESLRGAGSAATNFNQQAIAVAATASAIGVGLKSAASSAIAFEQGLARIGSISDFSRSQLESLKRKVLEITQAIGIEAPTALRALYEIISAGIPEQNALTVFEKASKAAIAGFTDIDTAARVGISVLNSYGLQVSQLDSVYDKLFVTVRDGIVTFPQLAQDLGAVLPAARQAGVSLDQVSAAMVTLTRSGLSVPEAATGIENAIKSLSAPAPEAAAALREAGISVGDFGKTLDEVAKKNLSLSFLREIIPDARAIRAVAAITQNYNTYSDAIKSAGDSAGAAKKAFDALKDTPEQQIKKLMASVEALKVAIGDGLLKGVITGVNALRDLAKEAAEMDKQALALAATLGGGALTAAVAALAARFGGLSTAAGASAAALAGFGGFQLGQTLADWSPKVKVFGDLLGGFLAAGVTDVSARFSLLKATIEGNAQAQEQARATIAANAETWREFNGVTASSRLAIADLTKKQRELNDQLDKAKNTAIDSLGKYGEALQPVTAAVDEAFNRVSKAINTAEGQVRQYQSRLAAAADSNKLLFDVAIAGIEQSAAQQAAAVERAIAKQEIAEAAGLQRIAKIHSDAGALRIAALQRYAVDAIAIVDKENQARLELAKKSGIDVAKVELQNRDEKIKVLQSLREAYKSNIDYFIGEEQRLLDKVKELSQKRRDFNLDADAKIRELGRGGLSEYQQRADRLLEIDQNLYAAREALEKGQTKQAEDFAKRAIALAGETAKAVTDADGKQVTQAQAIEEAQQRIIAARNLVNESIDKEAEAAKNSAAQFAKQREAAVAAFADIKSQLDQITALQDKEVKLRIAADTKVIDEEILKLRKAVEEQEVIQKVRLSIDRVKADIAEIKKLIEDGANEAVIQSATKQLAIDFKAAADALPAIGLKVDTKPVDEAFAKVKEAIDGFATQSITVKSNVADISQQIRDLSKIETTSKHTVLVTYVDAGGKAVSTPPVASPSPLAGFARGGLVGGASLPRFATGGLVGQVPGTGNSDSVLTYLLSGSYVLRKKAAEQLMANSRSLPGGRALPGGRSLPGDRSLDAGGILGAGDVGGASAGGVDKLIAQVKAAAVFGRAGLLDALMNETVNQQLGWLKKARTLYGPSAIDPSAETNTVQKGRDFQRAMSRDYIAAVARRDTAGADAITNQVVGAAETAIANLLGLKVGNRFDGFASGGGVPHGMLAMTTPGELVFNPAAVRAIGLPTLEALNAMRFNAGGLVPPGIAAMTDRLARFNMGGAVTNNASTNNTNNFGGVSVTINAGGTTDARQLARGLVDELNNIARRRK